MWGCACCAAATSAGVCRLPSLKCCLLGKRRLFPLLAAQPLPPCATQLNLGEPELALESMERVLQLAPGHPEAAAEVVSIRTLVVQRRQGGGTEAGQRARVQRPAEGGSDCMES